MTWLGLQEVWTLCRIFKRIPSYKKYTPDNWKEGNTKQNPTDSSSKTCSLESENYCGEPRLSPQDSVVMQRIEKSSSKPVRVDEQVDETNQWFKFVGETPYATSYSSLRDIPSDNDFFINGNWDELRPVVQLAVDPSFPSLWLYRLV